MKKWIVITIIIFIGAGVFWKFFISKNNNEIRDLITIRKGDLVQVVNVTGRVKSADLVKLSFEISGRVENVYATIGDRVVSGQSLVALHQESLLAQREEGRAAVAVKRAKLAELRSGSRPEEVQVSKVKVENAMVALDDAKRNLADKIKDAYTKSDDAIRNKVDQFFSNPRSNNPQMNFLLSDSQLKSDIERERFDREGMLTAWKQSQDTIVASGDLAYYLVEAKNNLDRVKLFLDRVALAVNSLTPNSSLNQTTIEGYKTDVSAARANANTGSANVLAADEKLRNANSSLALAEQELTLTKAGPTKEAVDFAEAEIQQATTKMDTLEVELGKTILYAPLSGTVTKVDVEPGEIVSPNVSVISIIVQSDLEIEVNVPEVDIGKLAVGNTVHMSYDAFPHETFFGAVTFIEPAETIIDGVVNFRVVISFAANDPRIKSGFTANLEVETQKKSAVLLLPQFAIMETDQGAFVKKVEESAVRDVPITLGIRGRDGMMEVVSGVVEGDRVQNVGLKNVEK